MQKSAGSGILFNDPYGIPVVQLDERAKSEVTTLIERIRKEQGESDLAFGEVMLAYLKVMLILAARLKSPKAGACGPGAIDLRHPILVKLRDLIEENYHTLHSPADDGWQENDGHDHAEQIGGEAEAEDPA